jgi:hypothetical protein
VGEDCQQHELIWTRSRAELVEVVDETMQPTSASLWLRASANRRRAVEGDDHRVHHDALHAMQLQRAASRSGA